jgi:DNA topoisomerase-1
VVTAERNGKRPELGERGVASEGALYSLDGTLADWRRPSARDLDEMLARDGQARALKLALTLSLSLGGYELEPAEGDKGEAEFCREVLFGGKRAGGMTTPMPMVFRQMASAAIYRAAFFEKVWRIRPDGRLTYHKLAFRPATTCRVIPDENGSFGGFKQEGFRNGRGFEETFGPEKAFVYFFRGGEAPLRGESAFQTAWHDAEHKKKIRTLDHMHLQKFGVGILVGKTSAGKEGQESLRDRLNTVRGGGVVVVGKEDEEVALLTGGQAGADFREAEDFVNAEMARSFLLQFLMLGTGSNTGAWSLSRDHSDFYLRSVESTREEQAEVVTEYVVSDLVAHNFGEGAAPPRVVAKPLSESDKQRALDLWEKLATSASPRAKPAMLDALEEKVAQAVGVDPEKLKGEEAPEASEPDTEAVRRAAAALARRGRPGGSGTGLEDDAEAAELGEDEALALAEEFGLTPEDVIELHLRTSRRKGSHNEKSHGNRRGRFAARGFEEATAQDRKRLGIPPAWAEVQVSRERDASLLAVGLDAKGREQRIYSAAHHERQAAAKFARIEKLHERLPEIDRRLSKDAQTDDTALAALLIRRMGLRPGSDANTGAEKKAHGATNLKASHIKVDGDTIRANFTGKKGVDLDLSLDDPELARLLEDRRRGKGGEERLLDTDERKLRTYMGRVAPGVKPKDLRTYLGTATAMGLVVSMPIPKTERENRSARRQVAEQVSRLLGNTPTVALASYIAPAVFGPWDAAMARK